MLTRPNALLSRSIIPEIRMVKWSALPASLWLLLTVWLSDWHHMLVGSGGCPLPGSKFPWRESGVGPARLYFNYLTIQISDSIIEPRAAPCSEQVHWHQDMVARLSQSTELWFNTIYSASSINQLKLYHIVNLESFLSQFQPEMFCLRISFYESAVFVFPLTFLPLHCLVFRRLT